MRFLFPLLLCFGLLTPTFAQNLLWTRAPQGPYDSEGERIDIDSAGNVYVFGTFYNSLTLGGITPTGGGTTDGNIYLAKYAGDGSLIWVKAFGANSFRSYAGDVKIDKRGDIIIFGYFYLPTLFYGQQFSGAVLAKISPSGNLIWAKQDPYFGFPSFGILETNNGGASRLTIDSQNNIVILAGGDITGTNDPDHLYLLKYDEHGNQLWSKMIATYEEYPFDVGVFPRLGGVTVDTHDNIIIIGSFEDYITIGTKYLSNHYPKQNRYDDVALLFIAKFSSNGSFEWAIQGDNAEISEGYQIVTDASDNIYFTGLAFSGATIAGYPTNATYQNGFIAMMSPLGNVKWLNLFPTSNTPGLYNAVRPYGIAKDPVGGLYITGSFFTVLTYQNYSTPISSSDYYQMFVMKVTLSGDFLGIWNTDDNNYEYRELFQSIPDAVSNVYVIGTFDGTTHFSATDSIATSPNESAMVLLKLGSFPVVYDMFIKGPEKFCKGSTVTLTTNYVPGASNYTWNLPSGMAPVSGSATTATNSILVITNLDLNDAAITVSTSTIDGKTYLSPPYFVQSEISIVGPLAVTGPMVVCPASTSLDYQCSAIQDALEYEWSLPTGMHGNSADSLLNERILSINDQFTGGIVTVTARGKCNILVSNTLNIQSIPPPGRPKLHGPENFCANQSTSWWVDPVPNAINYTWKVPAGLATNTTFEATLLLDETSPGIVAGYLKVTPNGQCGRGSFSDSLLVKSIPLPVSATLLGGPPKVCLGDTGIEYTVPPIDHATTYQWNIPSCFASSGTVNSNSNSIQVDVASTTQGAITVQGVNQCNQPGTPTLLVVTVESLLAVPQIKKGNCDAELSTDGSSNIQWFNNQTLLNGDTNKVIHVVDSGYYKVRVQNYCGITESNTIQVYPIVFDKLFFPNVITPDGNSKNEFFIIDKSLQNSALRVINRWGGDVFVTDRYENNWNGGGLDTGVYYYYLMNSCLENPIKGSIQILR